MNTFISPRTPATLTRTLFSLTGLILLLLAVGCAATRTPRDPADRAASSASGASAAEWLTAIEAAVAQHVSATDPVARATAAELAAGRIADALKLPRWPTSQRLGLLELRRILLRNADLAQLDLAVEQDLPRANNRESYAAAMTALDHLHALFTRLARADHWSQVEQAQWSRCADETDQLRRRLADEFNAAIATVQDALGAEQRTFVNQAGIQDLWAARKLRDAQDAKYFNWGWLNHPRDDVQELAKAVLLCRRVLAEPRMDHPVNLAAARLQQECWRRLGRSGEDFYHQLHPLTAYSQMPGYPDLTPDQIRQQAEQLWRDPAAPDETAPADASDRPGNHPNLPQFSPGGLAIRIAIPGPVGQTGPGNAHVQPLAQP